jgi:signal transduction histidine kinase
MCLWAGPDYALIYNDPYRRILAAKHPVALGQPGAVVWAEIWDELRPQFDGVRAGGSPLYFEDAPFVMARLEGGGTETAWFDYSLSALRDEDGSVAAILNVTPETTGRLVLQRRLIAEQAALAESDTRLRKMNEDLEEQVAERLAERNVLATLFEITDVMIMAVDLDYVITAINKANADEFERIYGVRPKVGDNMLDLLAHSPEEQAQVRAGWARGLSGDEVTFVEDYGDRDRVRPYYEIKFRTLRNDAGEPIGTYQFVTDVTQRLRDQALLQDAQEALRQSQKMEAMGNLTGGVAHDFNNLLTPIIGSLDMLMRKGVGSERERRLIDGALQSAERAKTLVQRLLAFARRQPLQPTAVDVGRLVEGMTGLIESTLGPTIEMRLDVDPALPAAQADPNQLEMALLNLAVNARDAMPEGGDLTITVSHEVVRRDDLADIKAGRYIRLAVTDNGVGMDVVTMARAIEPFFSTKGVGKGTGLGLSMVHGLAAQLGGGLTIRSTPGAGTSIALWLPISDADADVADEAAAISESKSLRGTVLLVDDEDLVRMSTADMLTELGFDVVEAGSAEEALGLICKGGVPDLLVTDHLMPGMSGAALAREGRRIKPELPVLIVSGYAEVEGVAPDLPRLTKPFRNAELASMIATLMTTTQKASEL